MDICLRKRKKIPLSTKRYPRPGSKHYRSVGVPLLILGLFCNTGCFMKKSDLISDFQRKFEKFCISKFQKLGALRKLEARGLTKLERHPRSNPRVNVVDPPSVRSN